VSSALDLDTERALWARLLRDRQATLLVVSNRPATLARAHQVITLDHGHVRHARQPPRDADTSTVIVAQQRECA
jgi:ABC-type transport system involved in Fe-S cluster assembly fused permease/ATPase subunit